MTYKIVSQADPKQAKRLRNRYQENIEKHVAHVMRNRKERGMPAYRKDQRDYRNKRRIKLLMFLGGRCEWCDNNDMRVLQLDHVAGDGAKERRKLNGHDVINRAFDKPNNYQLLCANCNWIKRFENNEHRKQIDQ